MTGTTDAAGSCRARATALHLFLPAVLLCAPSVALAEQGADKARLWLERMTRAVQSLNYDGTFVYRNGDSMESMRIIHRGRGKDGERERLISLTGVPREVLRDRDQVTCILPDSKSVLVAKSHPRGVADPTAFTIRADLERFYKLTTGPGERVAGRTTQLVVVKPRDRYRYGYRLAIDRATGLLLKSELVGDTGHPLEQVVYTTLSTPATIPDRLLRPGISGHGFTWYRTAPDAEKGGKGALSDWDVGWLPKGFSMSERVRDLGGDVKRKPVEYHVYSDGLASLSVFIERLGKAAERLQGLSMMGAVSAFGSVIDDFQITVVGEVPDVTVEKVGRSVHRRSP